MRFQFNFTSTFLMACLSITSFNVFANDASVIDVDNAYIREVPPGAMATGSFLTLKNNSEQEVRLVGATSDVAKKVQLHTHINDNGVMKMRQIKYISVAAHQETKLQPGGLHIMFIGLQKELKKGQTIPMTLKFKDGSQKSLMIPVKSVMNSMNNLDHH
ncbi:copper chaperone PCu(A)C [Hydrogenovibrio sp. 3SP14C1]|uniref:copper chaperone PCu(A)C n=1 Tax=Hydrogenovibrio sp. 3SP14C1 TaxID=3038774 RepID=UPI002416C420|nr:copper chaperone PCu(A)C [Hydrogenovibrio sp. 3SP14C1]MDG4813332.1 copper chaperone PCu(A)C [Hydrogenovibrio sp. 3SP14C1]